MGAAANNPLFSSDLWSRVLESYAQATQLTIKVFDVHAGQVLGPVNATPLFQLFEEATGYDPGIFMECASRCLAQTNDRPAVMVSEFCGLSVIGTSLVLAGEIVGAVVGGYALVDFFQVSDGQRLAQNSGIHFEQLWRVTREQRPVPKQRLVQNGELLQILGDALLRENSHTRQYGAALNRSEEQLRALAAQMMTSQEDERRRVARELHDDICQKLAVLEIDAHQMEPKILRDPDGAIQDLQQLRDGIGSLSEDVRRISHALHSSLIDDLGLVPALRSLLEDLRERENMIVTFIPQDVPEEILPQTVTGLYRIAQEALRNIARHAGKTNVKVILKGRAGGLRLEIIDFGRGFDVRASRSGLGLVSMEERAHMMYGSCKVESEIGKGTMVSVDVPLEG